MLQSGATEINLYTYQDFESESAKGEEARTAFVINAIQRHMTGDLYKTALIADQYDKQQNATINDFIKIIYTANGKRVKDPTATNQRIASNYFHRLNTQRCMYSLANGVSFVDANDAGKTQDATKERLGVHFDHDLQDAAYNSLIHGIVFCFWSLDRLYNFTVTEFVPLWDEHNGQLRAGIRFWQLSPDTPMNVVLYEEDGYTTYRADSVSLSKLDMVEDKRAYIETIATTPADDNPEVIGEENYSRLPIVPLWGSKLHQSTLVGMRASIDAYDLINSGYANDLQDCAEVYWIVENAGGMTTEDLSEFLDKLKYNHIVEIDTGSGAKATPYTQDVPTESREAFLKSIRNQIYEDFGALDVHTVAAGATNDHIDAAYQPMDEEAADFEYQLEDAIMQILALMGIEDTPVFKRNRISNQMEQVQMVVMEAQWLDRATVLRKLPNVTPEEVQAILESADVEDFERMGGFGNSITVREDGAVTDDTDDSADMLNGAQATAIVSITQQARQKVISRPQAEYLISKVLAVPIEEARAFIESGTDEPMEEETEEEEEEDAEG